MATYYGTATYYDCTTGVLACGGQPCPKNSGGLAYPILTNHPPDYSAACTGGMAALSCGTYISLYNLCNGGDVLSPIIDHGPGAACRVDSIPCTLYDQNGNVYGYAYRLLDLTPTTFMDVGGSLSDGRVVLQIDTP
jgi:hypothetical protein